MAYVECDTTPRYTAPDLISDEELHFLIHAEFQRLPFIYAVFTLWDNAGPIFVGTGALRSEVLVASAKHPMATRFSLSGLNLKDHRSTEQLAQRLKQEYGLQGRPTKREPIGFRH